VGALQTRMAELRPILDPKTDRALVVRLDPRCASIRLGQAEPLASTDYFHIL
jgi:hypothetical protein